jgi:hypothetical protein
MDILVFSILTNFLYYCAGSIFVNPKKNDFHSQFYIYFIGLIFISGISLFLNFFVKLSPALNTSVYVIIIFFFIVKTNYSFDKENFKFLFLSSIITFSLILFSNINRPDAGLYHLPFVSLINDSKIIFGSNNIHFRFGHTSIMQYLSAINYNLLFKENGISIPLASVISFFYIYFFYDIYKVIKKKETIKIDKVFSLFVSIYITYKINRYSSFGNDAVAHLTFFYLISYVLKNKLDRINVKKSLLIAVFIFINKTTLGLAFIIPTTIFFIKEKFKFKKIIYVMVSPASLLLYLWFIKNIVISGCAIYPIKFTCFESLSWSNIEKTAIVATQGEAWSKAWPDRIDRNINVEEFNKNLNWVNAWTQKHLKYIIKIIFPFIIVLLFIVLIINRGSKRLESKISNDLKIRIFLLLITSILGSVSFFLLFPLYRYGYSYLLTLIIILFMFPIITNFKSEKNINLFKFFFIFCVSILILKQSYKVFTSKSNNRWPNIYSLSLDKKINKKKKIGIKKNFSYYQSVSGDYLCMYSKSPCTTYPVEKNINHKKKYGYSILSRNK